MFWIRQSSNMITLYDVYNSTEYICYNIVRCLQFDRAHTSKHCTIFWIRQSTHIKTLHDVYNSTEHTFQNIARCFEFDRVHISKHCTMFWIRQSTHIKTLHDFLTIHSQNIKTLCNVYNFRWRKSPCLCLSKSFVYNAKEISSLIVNTQNCL